MDTHKNLSYSTVATAPSPASSGTSLVVAAGDGAKFPAVPFNVTVWPAGAIPLTTNAEIATVTTIATDTLTIVRAAEGTAARSIIVGDQIAATITAKTLTDAEQTVETVITQAAHGFVAGDVLRLSGTTYVKAQADSEASAEVVGIVSASVTSGIFRIVTHGKLTGLTGLTAGTAYYLSPSSAGALTATEPSAVGQVSKPVLVADSTTSGYVYNFRGAVIPNPSPFDSRFHGVRVQETSNQTITTGATGETITFSAETYDSDGYHDTGSNTDRLTVPSGLAGYYQIIGQVRWDAQTAGTYRRVRIYSSSSGTALAESLMEPEASGWSGHNLSGVYYLNVGDYVTMVVDHDRGSDLLIVSANSPAVLSMHLLVPASIGPGDGWTPESATWTYASSTTFTVPGDQTVKFSKGTRIKLTQTTAKYFVVAASSYGAPNTTVTITGGTDYTLANAAITNPYYSYAANPQGYPGWFYYSPTYTGFSVNPSGSSRFAVNGKVCTVLHHPGDGTSNANGFTLTLPIPSFIGNRHDSCRRIDNGGASASPGLLEVAGAGDTTINVYRDHLGAGWTTSGTKNATFAFTYEI